MANKDKKDLDTQVITPDDVNTVESILGAEPTPVLGAEDVRSGDVTITDLETGEYGPFAREGEPSIPGKPTVVSSAPFSSSAVGTSAAKKKSDEEKISKLGKPRPRLGKQWKGQQFVTSRTAEDIEEEKKLKKKHAHKNAIPINAYFVTRGVRDPVKRAAMQSYTKVRMATVEVFDSIFVTF